MIKKGIVTLEIQIENVSEDDLENVCGALASGAAKSVNDSRKPKVLSIRCDTEQVFNFDPKW